MVLQISAGPSYFQNWTSTKISHKKFYLPIYHSFQGGFGYHTFISQRQNLFQNISPMHGKQSEISQTEQHWKVGYTLPNKLIYRKRRMRKFTLFHTVKNKKT